MPPKTDYHCHPSDQNDEESIFLRGRYPTFKTDFSIFLMYMQFTCYHFPMRYSFPVKPDALWNSDFFYLLLCCILCNFCHHSLYSKSFPFFLKIQLKLSYFTLFFSWTPKSAASFKRTLHNIRFILPVIMLTTTFYHLVFSGI